MGRRRPTAGPAAVDADELLGEIATYRATAPPPYGIRNIRVFGSFARGEGGPESDLDLLVEYVPGRGGFAFVESCEEAERLLGRKVDVVTDKSLHPRIRDKILGQAVPL